MKSSDFLKHQFIRELKRRGIPVLAQLPGDSYLIQILGAECIVCLDSLRRNVRRDKNPNAVSNFIDSLLATRAELPPWLEAASGIRYSAEASDYDFGNTLQTAVTPAMSRVLVFANAGESYVSWLTPNHLASWGISRSVLESHAAANMDFLLGSVVLEVQSVAGFQLAMFSTDSIFKASLLFSPGLKSFVSRLGWPVFIVAPCRDFVYVFTDKELIPRLGEIVMREFNDSGHPVTPEVLQVSDSGITALGTFGAHVDR